MKAVIALSLGFSLGAACRWFDIPVPSPPKLLGALLVLAITLGYMSMDNWMSRNPAPGRVQAAEQTQVPKR